MLVISFHNSFTFFIEARSLNQYQNLDSGLAPGILPLCSQVRLVDRLSCSPGIFMSFWGSSIHACTASALTTEPSPQAH